MYSSYYHNSHNSNNSNNSHIHTVINCTSLIILIIMIILFIYAFINIKINKTNFIILITVSSILFLINICLITYKYSIHNDITDNDNDSYSLLNSTV